MEYTRLPDEYNLPPDEYRTAAEFFAPAPEDAQMTREIQAIPEEYLISQASPIGKTDKNTAYAAHAAAKKRRRQREVFRSLMAPVAAVIATISIVWASFNYDLFVLDFLGKDTGPVTPPEISIIVPTDPVETTTVPIGPVDPTETATQEPTEAPTIEPSLSEEDFTATLLPFPEGSVSGAEEMVLFQYIIQDWDGNSFTTSLSDPDPVTSVKNWCKERGLIYKMKFMEERERTRTFLGYKLSEDAITAGSGDSPARLTLLSGTIYAVYKEVVHYETHINSHGPGYFEMEGDTAFPMLSNLAPDFIGAYTQSGIPEEFIRMVINGESTYRYLVIGETWENPPYNHSLGDVPGASYDEATNTLTLENCTADVLDINLMGNGFTVNLIGENRIGYILVYGFYYGGSIKFTGNGSLVVNEDQSHDFGLMIDAEQSQSILMVDKGVDLEFYGSKYAIVIARTTMDKAIWFLDNSTLLSGGERYNGPIIQYNIPVRDESGNMVYENGELLMRSATIDEYSALVEETCYDYTVITPDGDPATAVFFEPRE